MKTTIELDDALREAIERSGAREGATLQDIVERALRVYLDHPARQVPDGFKMRRHPVGGRGLRPEVVGASEAEYVEMSYELGPPSRPHN